MKRILLDTHVLVWFAEGSPSLAEHARKRVQRASGSEGLAVSAISFWEVAMLAARGRLSLSRPASEWRRLILQAPGFLEAPLDGEIALDAASLGAGAPKDPADRFLAATARVLGFRLATRDRRILDWAKSGRLDVLSV